MNAAGTPQRIIGRYALFDEIGAGGMATVHLGRLLGPSGFSRTVAIKRLHANFAKDPEFAEMFLDEARLAARVQHPNVVPTLDVVSNDGELYLVMDLIQGESLARLRRDAIARRERVPPRVAASVMAGALNGLHAAHEAKSERGEPLGIVHRDVSPHNVIVGTDGVARVLDFGVAKAVWRQNTTREGQLKGKLAYMAPEQFAATPIDRRVDVYAAAVTLWEVLVGARLFDAESPIVVMSMITSKPIQRPSELVPGVPPALDDVVMRGLSRDRDARFATAREMAMALESAGPIASQRELGEWVERIAGDTLHTRARRVAEVEGVSGIIARPSATVAIAGRAPRTSDAPTKSFAPPESSAPHSVSAADANVVARSALARARPFALGLVAALVATGVGLTLALQPPLLHATTATQPLVGAAFDLAAAANAEALASASPEPAPPPTTSADAPSAPRATTMAAAAAPTTPPAPRSVAKPAKRAECSPPYTIDAAGIRRPKVQCL